MIAIGRFLFIAAFAVTTSGLKVNDASATKTASAGAGFTELESGVYCGNRGGVANSNDFSTNIESRDVQACADYVLSVQGCGHQFNYGNGDGWCDCVPQTTEGGVCDRTPYSYSDYRVYELTDQTAVATPPPQAPAPALDEDFGAVDDHSFDAPESSAAAAEKTGSRYNKAQTRLSNRETKKNVRTNAKETARGLAAAARANARAVKAGAFQDKVRNRNREKAQGVLSKYAAQKTKRGNKRAGKQAAWDAHEAGDGSRDQVLATKAADLKERLSGHLNTEVGNSKMGNLESYLPEEAQAAVEAARER